MEIKAPLGKKESDKHFLRWVSLRKHIKKKKNPKDSVFWSSSDVRL